MTRYLFIGGPLHGQERKTDGAAHYTAFTQAPDKTRFGDLPVDLSEPVFERTAYRLDRYACTDPQGLREVYVKADMTGQDGERALMRLLLKRWIMADSHRCPVDACGNAATQGFGVRGRGIVVAGRHYSRGSTLELCVEHAEQLASGGAPGHPMPDWLTYTPGSAWVAPRKQQADHG
jgi:hypothetical protein